jgi:hypothetical protein
VALAAVHVPTDPDTERLLQSVFTATVRHVAALHELRPDPLTALSAASGAGEEEGAPSRAVFSVLVVLGKVFKQANPSLIPL